MALTLLVGCRPNLQSQYPEDRKRALKEVNDPAVLVRVALEDRDIYVREVAIGRISDPSLLAQIATEEPSEDVAGVALDKITDQATLAQVARRPCKIPDHPEKIGLAAASRLTGQGALAELVLASENPKIREFALSRVTDQAQLIHIALTSTDSEIPGLATERITDQAVLARIALDPDSQARVDAIIKLSDQSVLEKIATDLKSADYVRAKAVAGVKDVSLLTRLAVSDRETDVRTAALDQLSDGETFLQLALREGDSEVRMSAMDGLIRLGDKSVAGTLSTAFPEWSVNEKLAATLEALGWKATSESQRVYFWIGKRDSASLAAHWETTRRVLLGDIKSGTSRRIENAVYTFLSLGKVEIIPELVRAMDESGTRQMAETYLNCGNADLHLAGENWAKKNGYDILQNSSSNTGAVWGEWSGEKSR